VLVEAHGEWQVSDRRYLSEGSMALLTATMKEVASAQLMPASTPDADPARQHHLHHAAGRHPPQAAPTEGRRKGAAAPMHQ
jgi:hypothetical protein